MVETATGLHKDIKINSARKCKLCPLSVSLLTFSEPPLTCLLPDGLLSFSFLMLITIVPYQSSSYRQRIQVYLSWIVIIIVYSALISLFKVKNRGKVIIYSVMSLRLNFSEQDIRSRYFSRYSHLCYPRRATYGLIEIT